MKISSIIMMVMMLMQCAGCKSVEHGCWWVVAGYGEWRQDVRNSKQKKHYSSALKEKLNPVQPMISIYDDFFTPTGKKFNSGTRQTRLMTLFADGSFIALEGKENGNYSMPQNVIFISGAWKKESGTMASLQRRDGTNFIDYAFVNLSSVTNFLAPNIIELPFGIFPTYDVQRTFYLEKEEMSYE